MSYSLVSIPQTAELDESEYFIEGAILAANISREPLDPNTWLTPLFGDQSSLVAEKVTEQIHQQYHALKRSDYSLLDLVHYPQSQEPLADFAEGFMQVWPVVEPLWQQATLADGTARMLQALLTVMMLAIDEEQTQQQMKQAGFEHPPALSELAPQLDLMINEVALAADEALMGGKSQSVNPYKQTGRNDPCPCGSGKKFKQCCGN
ncbi:SEC-C metal-binding domain-containing protein [Vibrio olivae]|uniref:SEC-C metal-binding domain-containing protein n=1 Tax=Vibrio olivae TaxID=1243002 RepID=A0ABV5HHP5_9VIBR